ncbi:hypothetical protein H7Y63_00725 [Polaromonas sp.]|nr:hypothetical protein [Candidatus Saccharibacteria bacterium]
MQPNDSPTGPQPEPTDNFPPTTFQPQVFAPTQTIAPTVTQTPEPVVILGTSEAPTSATSPVLTPTPQAASSNSAPAPSSVEPAGPVVGGDLSPNVPAKKRLPKKLIFGGAALALIAIAGAAFYFGYYTNSSMLYAQALGNSGKGISELTKQFTEKQFVTGTSYTGSGTYKVDSRGFTTDGKLAFKSDDKNSETTFDVGLGTSRVNVALRTIKSAGTSPDIYIKADRLNALESMLGPQVGKIASKYDGKWIVVDHTLIDNAQKQATSTAKAAPPSVEQITEEIKAFDRVNQEYLFSNNKDKAVTKIVKSYGLETVDGHKVIHYQVALDKTNTKKYISAQYEAVKTVNLYDWIKSNNYAETLDGAHASALKSADTIMPTDTFDLYADVNSRLIYKLRFADKKNPAINYVDIGLDAVNRDVLPFFLSAKDGSNKRSIDMKITANTKTNELQFKMNVSGARPDKYSFASDFTFKPAVEKVSVAVPTGAIQLGVVFKDLGLGDPANLASGLGARNTANTYGTSNPDDAMRQANIMSLQTQLEAFYSAEGYYPGLAQLNDPNWRATNMKYLDPTALSDPASNSKLLSSKPAAQILAYEPLDASGKACSQKCTSYTLTATLSTGTQYIKKSLE